jgi:hypothetical protein
MEWLLIIYFNSLHGSVSTERMKTYEECKYVGELVRKESTHLGIFRFNCIEIKKLENK